MRLANLAGRSIVVVEGGAVDVERASAGRFSADPQAVYERWDDFRDWIASATLSPVPFDERRLGAPVPLPRQVFAIGLNYRAHAEESGMSIPDAPSVFTKYVTALTGPQGQIDLVEGDVDWEVELVVVIGREAFQVADEDAWSHVAGLTIGQDLSERRRQLAGGVPQFSLAKSHPGFAPTGPWLVTPDELEDPDDLSIRCSVNGEEVQDGRTSDLIFSVPRLVSELSRVLPLLPGDLIFTGTPAGVGMGRTPARYLQDGDVLVTEIEGIGQMRHTMVGPRKVGHA